MLASSPLRKLYAGFRLHWKPSYAGFTEKTLVCWLLLKKLLASTTKNEEKKVCWLRPPPDVPQLTDFV